MKEEKSKILNQKKEWNSKEKEVKKQEKDKIKQLKNQLKNGKNSNLNLKKIIGLEAISIIDNESIDELPIQELETKVSGFDLQIEVKGLEQLLDEIQTLLTSLSLKVQFVINEYGDQQIALNLEGKQQLQQFILDNNLIRELRVIFIVLGEINYLLLKNISKLTNFQIGVIGYFSNLWPNETPNLVYVANIFAKKLDIPLIILVEKTSNGSKFNSILKKQKQFFSYMLENKALKELNSLKNSSKEIELIGGDYYFLKSLFIPKNYQKIVDLEQKINLEINYEQKRKDLFELKAIKEQAIFELKNDFHKNSKIILANSLWKNFKVNLDEFINKYSK